MGADASEPAVRITPFEAYASKALFDELLLSVGTKETPLAEVSFPNNTLLTL
jgi:hypothetical protein